MIISHIIFFISGIVISGLSIPLIRRKVKVNSWYGIRIPQTMENEKVWYAVNEKMGKYIFVWGILISILSLYFSLNPTNPKFLMTYILLSILILGTVLLVILSYKIANKHENKQ